MADQPHDNCFDLFISHNNKDKAAVIALAERLKANGVKVWLNVWELCLGEPWQESAGKIIVNTRAVAVLVGIDGIGPWEDVEMHVFLDKCVQNKMPIIPVLLPGCPKEPILPLLMQHFTWADFREGKEEEGFGQLMRGITGEKPDIFDNVPKSDDNAECNMFKGYEHYVFLSYPHGQQDSWRSWVKDIFKPELEFHLGLQLPRLHPDRSDLPDIFVDDQIQCGDNWEKVLKNKVAHSMFMVALMTPEYFRSEWCRRELALMLERKEYLKQKKFEDNYCPIKPLKLCTDGSGFPPLVPKMQYLDFQNYTRQHFNVDIKVAFENEIIKLVNAIVCNINCVPECCDDWIDFEVDKYLPKLVYKQPIRRGRSLIEPLDRTVL